MKVVFIITGLSTGGAETMLLKLIQNIDRSIFEVYVISLTSMGEIGPRIVALGVPVESLGAKGSAAGALIFFKVLRRLHMIKPDVVHTWMYHADLIGGLASRLLGVRGIIWGIRHSNLSPLLNKKSTLLTAWLCARLSTIIPNIITTCSETARKVHISYGYSEKKMHLIPNGFELDRFQQSTNAKQLLRQEISVPLDTKIVGLIGRFDPVKNHTGFLIAAKIVHLRLPNVHFVLAGKDIEYSNTKLLYLINNAGLSAVVHLLGLRNDIPTIMAGLDVLASSSDGEAFPNVLGEAMACSVPCVVTDVGDSSYIVGKTGRVVAQGDMVGLGTEIVKLLDLPLNELRLLGINAHLRVKEFFEINAVTKKYEDTYKKLTLH